MLTVRFDIAVQVVEVERDMAVVDRFTVWIGIKSRDIAELPCNSRAGAGDVRVCDSSGRGKDWGWASGWIRSKSNETLGGELSDVEGGEGPCVLGGGRKDGESETKE